MLSLNYYRVHKDNLLRISRTKLRAIMRSMKIKGGYLRFNGKESAYVIYFIGSDGTRKDFKIYTTGEVKHKIYSEHLIALNIRSVWYTIEITKSSESISGADLSILTELRHKLTGL